MKGVTKPLVRLKEVPLWLIIFLHASVYRHYTFHFAMKKRPIVNENHKDSLISLYCERVLKSPLSQQAHEIHTFMIYY